MGLIKTSLDDLSYRVNGLAMEVQSELKPGYREQTYQRRLAQRLIEAGIQTDFEKQIEVFVDEAPVGYMYIDLWVEQVLVVECKAFSHLLTNDDVGQAITYLAATGSPVGLVFNFGRAKLDWKRILPPKNVQEWHKHLFCCVWTPPGASLPPLESISSSTPIRFSVYSQFTPPILSPSPTHPSVDHPSASPSSVDPSAPIRLSVPSSVDDPSSDDLSSAADSSAPIRLSASPSVDDPSPSADNPSADHPSVPIRLSVSPSVDDPSPSVDDPSSSVDHPSSYSSSGVNIDSGNKAVELMSQSVRSTYGPQVLAGIGAFGGLFDAGALKGMQEPVLVASIDGVGTKVKLAAQVGRYRSIGEDLVNHCINDILVQGAVPLFFLDYIASARLDPPVVAEIVSGIAAACRSAGCALLGGETAEMPGVYASREFDVAGAIIGVLERSRMLPKAGLSAGDLLIGLPSSGPHTNGYSLIRKIFADIPLETIFPELGVSLADALLAPHRSYLPLLQEEICRPGSKIKALAHITGGGFIENLPRVLPAHLSALVRLESWPLPPLFRLIQDHGQVAATEMYRVFNMGIGMVAIAAAADVSALQASIPTQTFIIGELIPGDKKVILS